MLKFRSPNLRTIIIVTKIRKGFLKKKERIKGFVIFMTVPTFKQVESSYNKRQPFGARKFFHGLNFG